MAGLAHLPTTGIMACNRRHIRIMMVVLWVITRVIVGGSVIVIVKVRVRVRVRVVVSSKGVL